MQAAAAQSAQAAVGCASGASVAEADHNVTHNVIFTHSYVDTNSRTSNTRLHNITHVNGAQASHNRATTSSSKPQRPGSVTISAGAGAAADSFIGVLSEPELTTSRIVAPVVPAALHSTDWTRRPSDARPRNSSEWLRCEPAQAAQPLPAHR